LDSLSIIFLDIQYILIGWGKFSLQFLIISHELLFLKL
jgi:hypothetical protein